jgi:outer membrane receptor protein involved in Fe transport
MPGSRVSPHIAAAVSAALSAAAPIAAVRAQTPGASTPLEVIIVSATRREANVQDIPFNIAALGPQALERQRITDLAEFTRAVPGLYLADQGPRAGNLMTVRGLNVSSLNASESVGNGTGGTVASYMGDIPLYIDLKMIDMERIEALLGPQGTLYGAGTLGGAIRYLPNRPDPARTEANVGGRFYSLNESDGLGLDVRGVVNLPLIEDRLAVRAAVGYTDDPGFIDYDYLVREPGVSNPQPDFDDPADVAANLQSKEDADTEETLSGRVGLYWMVTDAIDANFTYYYQDQDVGGRTINQRDSFGTGQYVSGNRFLEPNEQTNQLIALELDWDLGFARLTSATGYSKYDSDGQRDQTDLLLDFEYGYEDFPSFVAYTHEESEEKTINQELRLVSQGEGPWSWIAGVFFNRFELDSSSSEFVPGFPEFIGLPPDTPTLEFLSVGNETFEERAVFGELGYQLTDRWQVTVGARWFEFEDDLEALFALPLLEPVPGEVNLSGNRNNTQDDDVIFKFNTSYRFTDDVMSYLTVSEGYRRGGINSGPACEDPLPPEQNVCLQPNEVLIRPDTTTNYELGMRSTWLDGALLVNASLYFIDWEDIQVTGTTVNGGLPITVNGSSAESKGLELATQWQLTNTLQVSASYSFNDAKLASFAPALVDGADGFDGDRLAGAPEQQGSLLVNYARPLENDWIFEANYGLTVVSDVYTKVGLRNNGEVLPGFALHNAALGLTTDRWTVRLYADNLFDKYAVTSVRRDPSYIRQIGAFDSRLYFQGILRPRTVGLELGYRFDL